MRKITDIYDEYKIMPNLQMHQLRVTAVAKQICESLSIETDKNAVIKACLLHDMGNIIKFTLGYFPEFLEPEGLEYWQKVKNDYIFKYGSNDHAASLAIAQEINVSARIYDLINCIDATVSENIAIEDDWEKKICAYADNRVSPYGVVSAIDHSINAKKRYKNHPHYFSEKDRSLFMKNLFSIEKQIFSRSKIKPEDINDASVARDIEILKDFEI
jgi:hypothetical protein